MLDSLDDLLAALDAYDAAAEAGTLRPLGAWSPGQIAWHVGDFMRASIEGFGFMAPLPMRLVGRLMKGYALGPRPTPRGIRLRGPLARFEPDARITRAEGFGHLRTQVERVRSGGERFAKPSPLLGALSHEEWTRLHLKHAMHHFAFLAIDEGATAGSVAG